jgi:long-subunit acyl-CoA synthetase (AMP-forming)
MLSYLPLAHIFDRTSEEMFLSFGGSIGYWQGILPELVSDVAALKPTMFVGVPRVFDRFYSRITKGIAEAGCIKGLLANWAYRAKLQRLQSGWSSSKAAPVWDKIVFKKVRQPQCAHSIPPTLCMWSARCVHPVLYACSRRAAFHSSALCSCSTSGPSVL